MSTPKSKILVILLIQTAIALIHIFRLGQLLEGQAYQLYYSYFSDLILPFGIYFLLAMNEGQIPALRSWAVKAGLIFVLTTGAEICQFFGLEVLGVTFDPLDILMYGLGVLAAAGLDVLVFARIFPFWTVPTNGKTGPASPRLT